ncbi:hypothetical protein FJ420_30605 [Mesorhizobium sp. B3-1-3]|uniref:hypothetical protein n=1 Tax=unclassified Mesorhizobium TaxID=325217 RepID=UPI001129366C|nr:MULTISPECIES: hypothetical protein [unclassified Mesorhizobium]TPI54209.1 hypothetical protein FJ424_31445 [Mesorhizobium sp. B3-1-8]TPI61429.1 hypothetical protein FJ420_30605 [Mesorhizobium sp. B3-1-3]
MPDLDTSLGALQKVTDSMRSLPFWLLAALATVSFALWKFPDQPVPTPSVLRDWLPVSAFTFGFAALCKLVSDGASIWLGRRRHILARAKMTLDKVYHPLAVLFMDRHPVTAATSIPFHLRKRKAWRILTYSRPRLNVVAAWRTLMDDKRTRSGEIQFGRDYPHDEIFSIVRSNITVVDEKLQNLVTRADRSRYEQWGDRALLTDEEMELLDHIFDERKKLLKMTRWVSSKSEQ